MDYRRPHPIHMVKSTMGYVALLILPVLRGLLYSGGDIYTWLRGAWFDTTIVIVMVMLGFISWYFNMFRIDKEGIYIFKGVFRIKKQFISYKNISSIIIENRFYLAPMRGAYVKVDTNAGRARNTDLTLIMRRRDAEKLINCAEKNLINQNQGIGRVYSPRILYIAVLSLISSNSLSGVILVSTFISQSGNLLGRGFEQTLVNNLTKLADILAFGVPPIAAIVAYALLGGWAFAFLLNILRNKNFSVTRRDSSILLRAGVITTRSYLLNVKKINLVEIRQTLLTKILGFFSVYINCSGYGKAKNSKSVLIPAAGRKEAMSNLDLILPEIRFVKREIKPKKADLPRFIFLPCSAIVIIAVLAIAFSYFFIPEFTGLVIFVAIMLEIIPIAFLIVGIIGYTHTGIGAAKGMLTASFTHLLTFCRISLPLEKLSCVEFRQNFFQRSTGCCNVVLHTFSEGTKKYVIKNLNQEQIYNFIIKYLN